MEFESRGYLYVHFWMSVTTYENIYIDSSLVKKYNVHINCAYMNNFCKFSSDTMQTGKYSMEKEKVLECAEET